MRSAVARSSGSWKRRSFTSGVDGVLPTPLDLVGGAVAVDELVDIGELPEDLRRSTPGALRRILGAYLYRSDTAFVDLSQPSGRKRFIHAHEAAHKLIPWHEASFHLDDEKRLFRETEELLELEANLAAALLIFQGRRFHERALDYENSIKTPILLADQYGASLHVTIRFYVEHHPDPLALAIAGRFPRSDWTVPVFTGIESKSFGQRFGSIATLIPAVPVREQRNDGAIVPLARAALVGSARWLTRSRLPISAVDSCPAPLKRSSISGTYSSWQCRSDYSAKVVVFESPASFRRSGWCWASRERTRRVMRSLDRSRLERIRARPRCRLGDAALDDGPVSALRAPSLL